MANVRLVPLLSSAAGLIVATVDGLTSGDSRGGLYIGARNALVYYTGIHLEQGFQPQYMQVGLLPAVLGNAISKGARMFGFSGNIVSTKRFKFSVF